MKTIIKTAVLAAPLTLPYFNPEDDAKEAYVGSVIAGPALLISKSIT